MSAQEIIEQIKAMPPEEQQEVREFVRTSQFNSPPPAAVAKPKRDVKAMIKEVFDEHDELFRKLAQ